MNYVLIFGATCALAFAGTAKATPVYLDCAMPDGKKEIAWNVTLDEVAGTVSYTIPEMGVVQKYLAVFTPNKVVFRSMEISRIDLSFKRTTNILGKVETDIGQCKLVEAPRRQF